MKTLIKNKKGDFGATLTWVFATFLIFFILLIFVIVTLALRAKEGQIEITKENYVGQLATTENLIAFLQSPVEFDGQKMKVKDLIQENLKDDEQKQKLFFEEAKKFREFSFPSSDGYYLFDLRLYDTGFKDKREIYPSYGYHSPKMVGGFAGGLGPDSESLEFLGSGLYFSCFSLGYGIPISARVFVSPNKIVELCANKLK